MRSLRRVLVGVLVTLFTAATLAGAVLAWRLRQGPIPLPSLDRRLEQALSGIAPNLKTQIDHSEIAWLRHLPELRVLGVKLERKDGKLLLSVPSLGIRPSLRAFLHGQLAVERVTVSGVQVALVRDANGGLLLGWGQGSEVPLDLSSFIGSGDEGSGAQYLKRIRVIDTDIRLEDRSVGGRWRADDLRLEVRRTWSGFTVAANTRLRVDAPHSPIFRVIDVPFSANALVTKGANGGFGDATFDVKVRDGHVIPTGTPGTIVALRSLAVQGNLSLATRRVELSAVKAAIGSAELEAAVNASLDGIHNGLDLTGEVRSLTVADIERLWPPSAAAATHDWITQNIRDGVVPRCRFAIHIPAGDAPLPTNAVDVAFNFEELTVDYLRDLTPVAHVRGSATLDADRFKAQVTSGELTGLRLSAGAVDIRYRGGPPWLKVEADIAGPAQDALAVIEHPPLEIPQAIGIPASHVDGQSSSHVAIELPLKHGLHSSEISVRVTSELQQTRITDLLGISIEGADLQVNVDGRRVDVVGDTASITGLPVNVGRTHLKVAYAPGVDAAPDELTVAADGNELRTRAKALLPGRTLATVKIDQLQLPGGDLAAVITRHGTGYHVSIDAAFVDLDAFLHGSTPGMQIAQRIRVPFDSDFRAQHFKVGKGVELTAVQGVARSDGNKFLSAHATASTPNSGMLRVDLSEREGARHLEIAADDAGRLLKGLGVFEDAEGGDLVLTATLNDGDGHTGVEGEANVRDFRVTKAPLLARLLGAGSLSGMAELLQGGNGLGFERAHVPFHWSADAVEMHDASAIGAIGITADGRVDRAARTIEIRGNLFPAYTLNSVLGKIPFVGKYITGGEDQGIFGIRFSVTGKLDNPEIEVNPLTALAPGVLRKMFVEPFRNDEDDEKKDEPQLAPTSG